jgi:hypothetical protein
MTASLSLCAAVGAVLLVIVPVVDLTVQAAFHLCGF